MQRAARTLRSHVRSPTPVAAADVDVKDQVRRQLQPVPSDVKGEPSERRQMQATSVDVKNEPGDGRSLQAGSSDVRSEQSETEPDRHDAFAGRLRPRVRPPTRQNPGPNGSTLNGKNTAMKEETPEERDAMQKGLKREKTEPVEYTLKQRKMSTGSNGEKGIHLTPQSLISLAEGLSESRDSLQLPDGFMNWVRGAEMEKITTLTPVNCSSDVQVWAQAGDYRVCNPSVTDSPRLRQLEREFVLDHWELFHADRWHTQPSLSDWCRLVNVIEHEQDAQHAISSIIGGQTVGHRTLACIHVPRAGTDIGYLETSTLEQPEIVGYVHIVRSVNGYMDISHLKVARAHQRRGLGSLLVAGAVRSALHLSWDIRNLRVVTVSRNPLAVLLYRALGFIHVGSVSERVCPGADGTAEWQKMRRPLHDCKPDEFADAVESRARTALLRCSTSELPD